MKQKFNARRFAADILKKREKENISYDEAEKQTGVYRSVLHRAESALPVSLETFPKICDWLNKSVTEYF